MREVCHPCKNCGKCARAQRAGFCPVCKMPLAGRPDGGNAGGLSDGFADGLAGGRVNGGTFADSAQGGSADVNGALAANGKTICPSCGFTLPAPPGTSLHAV